MRRVDVRVYVIAALAALAAGLGVYRVLHPGDAGAPSGGAVLVLPADISSDRIRSLIDTTAQALGAPKKFIARRSIVDSARVVLESSIGVPAAFDELHLITVLTDSVRTGGLTITAAKNLKEKTTTIRFWNRDHACIYRCILYRKELHH